MSAPEVRLHPEATQWVADRGGALTLRASPRHGCCGGTASLPVAEPGRPDDPADWSMRTVDGVAVYLDRALTGQEGPFIVRAEGFLGWRRLFVEVAEQRAD